MIKDLAKIQDSLDAQQKEENRKKIQDALAKRDAEKARRQAIKDALEKRRQELKDKNAQAIEDSKKYENFKVTDSFKDITVKVKDALEGTETTDAAVEAILALQNEEMPCEQLVAAVITVLSGVIDILEKKVLPAPEPEPEPEPAPEEPKE